MDVQLRDYFQAGYPLLYLSTTDYEAAEQAVFTAFKSISSIGDRHPVAVWKSTTALMMGTAGGQRLIQETKPTNVSVEQQLLADILHITNQYCSKEKQILAVFHNINTYLEDPLVVQAIVDLAYKARAHGSHLVFIGPFPYSALPFELQNLVTKVDFPLPSLELLRQMFTRMVLSSAKDLKDETGKSWKGSLKLKRGSQGQAQTFALCPWQKDLISQAAVAALGLDTISAENAFALSLASSKTVDVRVIQAQKIQAIKKSDILEFIQTDESLSSVGGFDLLKQWILKRKNAFGEEAREYGLPYPKGILIVGSPGTGKSHVSRSIAVELQLPLLRLDMGKVFQKYIGDSELAMRKALQTAEAVAPCVLQLDEVDKALAGSASSGENDSGVTARVLGTLLTWRQETKAPVMLVATANGIANLPAMIYRKGRIDEVFYVDLPSERERDQIFSIHIEKLKRDPVDFDTEVLAVLTPGWVGAEIEAVLHDAMYNAFAEGREVTSNDVEAAIKISIPQIVRDSDEIQAIRDWAIGKARPVSSDGARIKTLEGRKGGFGNVKGKAKGKIQESKACQG